MARKYDGAARPEKPVEHEPPQVAPPGKNKRKDLKRYCRGNSNTPHLPVIMARKYAHNWGCHRVEWARRQWYCLHREQCTRCGKVLRYSWQLELSECPQWDGLPFELGRAE